MHSAVQAVAGDADVIVMAAAVADYAPAEGAHAGKIEKQDGPLELTLVRTPDILAELGRAPRRRAAAGAHRLRGAERRPGRARPREAAPQGAST